MLGPQDRPRARLLGIVAVFTAAEIDRLVNPVAFLA
jgi:hypothetical protein